MVALLTHFYQRKIFVYSINVLNLMIPFQHQHINLIKTGSAHDCLQRIL